jgi:hypothetical protein
MRKMPRERWHATSGCGTSLRARVQRGAQQEVWGSLGAKAIGKPGLRLEPIASTTKGGAQIVRHDLVGPELIASKNRAPDIACRDAHIAWS